MNRQDTTMKTACPGTRLGRAFAMLKNEGIGAVGRRLNQMIWRMRSSGEQRVIAQARAKNATQYDAWIRAQSPDENERKRQHDRVFAHRVSYLIPTYNTEPSLLAALADSLLAQTSDAWEACFYDGCSPREETRKALTELAARDARFHVELGRENLGISGNTNRALALAAGDWVALVDHDDLLTSDATYCILCAAEDGADFVYSDEDKCDAAGGHFFEPNLKSDFAPDSLRAGNYICHVMAMEKALMESVGGLRSAFDGSQDHDLALRATERARRVTHIPRVLYHWRMLDTSASHQGAERCADAAARAVDEQMRRLNIKGRAFSRELRVQIQPELDPAATVTLIVTCRSAGLRRWLGVLEKNTRHTVNEVLLVGAEGQNSFQGKACIALPGRTDATELNLAAEQATGDYLVFITQGVTPQNADWMETLQTYAQHPDAACVGTAVLSGMDTYLHSGYAVNVPAGALSYHRNVSLIAPPYMLTDRTDRNVTAVSRMLLMIRRETFVQLHGFADYKSDLMSVALGMRARQAGLLNVYASGARAVWRGRRASCLTGTPPVEDLVRFAAEFGEHPEESYYSPLFERETGWMTLDLTQSPEQR